MAGRHRKPTNTARNYQRAALLTLGVGAPLALASNAYAGEVTVVEGDTLSEIAIDKLGLADWAQFYQDNRGVVGENPDLILPGQTLHFADGLLMPQGAPKPVDETPEVVTETPAQNEVVVPAPAPKVEASAHAIIHNSAGPVSFNSQRAADIIFSNVRGASLISIGGTRASAIDMHGHPSGNALDYMVNRDAALGAAIAQYHIDHWAELHVEYVIWQQRIKTSPNGAWQPMEDRGSATQNHMDHVHVNYLR